MTISRDTLWPMILFAFGAAATICLILLYAYAPDLRGNNSNQADAISRSAIGFAGLRALLQSSGVPVKIDRGVTAGEDAHPSLTILTPTILTTREDWRDYQEQGPVLIILPKWIVTPMPFKSGWVEKQAAWAPSVLQHMIAPIAALKISQQSADGKGLTLYPDAILRGLPAQLAEPVQDLQGTQAGIGTVLLRLAGRNPAKNADPRGIPVLVRLRGGDKPIYVLTEPDLMNDQGLSDESRAWTALTIVQSLRRGTSAVRMDVTLNGMARAPNLLKTVFEPPFRGATICALLTALLMALHALARFGAPPRDGRQLVRGKTALASNTAALVRMMGREAGMAMRYVQASREMVLARLGRRSGPEQDAALAAMERRAGSDIHYEQLVAEAARAGNGDDLLRIATQAYRWRGKITGEY